MKPQQLIVIGLVVGALVAPAAAQPPNAERRDRARTFLALRIADALKLNDQEALKVGSVIRQFDERRQELIKQRQALEDKLRAALGTPPPDTAQLTTLISEANDIDQKLALVPEESFRELQKTLTVEQQAKLMLFRRELQGEIRRAIQGRAGGGRRRGTSRGGPPAADE